jgi:hypothetical protein
VDQRSWRLKEGGEAASATGSDGERFGRRWRGAPARKRMLGISGVRRKKKEEDRAGG